MGRLLGKLFWTSFDAQRLSVSSLALRERLPVPVLTILLYTFTLYCFSYYQVGR